MRYNGNNIMNKKILLSSLIASSVLLTSQVGASDFTGKANFNLITPLVISETTQLNLGDIDIGTTGSCGFTAASLATGTVCLATGATQVAGVFKVTGTDGVVNVSVSGADTSLDGITFTPSVINATETIGAVTSGEVSFNVGGNVDVDTSGTVASGVQVLDYTVSVTY